MTYMTTAEWVGRREGRLEERVTLLTSQLEWKFNSIPAGYLKLIHEAKGEALLKWGRKILSAQTIEEVFN